MYRSLIRLLFSMSICMQMHADALDIIGTWMATDSNDITKDATGKITGKSSLQYAPGVFVVAVTAATLRTSLFIDDPMDSDEEAYTVQDHSADTVTIAIGDPKIKSELKTCIFKRKGSGMIMSDDRSSTTLVPSDPVAIAAVKKRLLDAARPAEPLADRPLSGVMTKGVAWLPILARRSEFQFDVTGTKIDVDITADRPKNSENNSQPTVRLAMPTTVGEYPFGRRFNMTVNIPKQGDVWIINGTLVVYKASATSVSFGLTARGPDGIVINGKMTADISPLPSP
jgi:hypothetical protein